MYPLIGLVSEIYSLLLLRYQYIRYYWKFTERVKFWMILRLSTKFDMRTSIIISKCVILKNFDIAYNQDILQNQTGGYISWPETEPKKVCHKVLYLGPTLCLLFIDLPTFNQNFVAIFAHVPAILLLATRRSK